MKKVFSFVAVAAMTVALFSCGEAATEEVVTGSDSAQTDGSTDGSADGVDSTDNSTGVDSTDNSTGGDSTDVEN